MQQQTASLPKLNNNSIQTPFAPGFISPQTNQLSKSNEQNNNKMNPLLVLPPFNQSASDKIVNSQSSSNKSQSSKNNNEFIDLINKLNNNHSNSNTVTNDNLIPMISLYSPITKQCQWPECQSNDVKYDSFESYLKLHLSKEHPIDQQSHQIIIKQLNTIDKLEMELKKQNQLLNDMLFHLRSQLNVLKQQQQQQQQQQQSNQNNQMFFAAMAAAAAAGRSVNDNNNFNNNTNSNKKSMKSSMTVNQDENNMIDYDNEDENSEEEEEGEANTSHGRNENDENDSLSQFRRPFERSSLSLSVGMYI